MQSKFDGKCAGCGHPIQAMSDIEYDRTTRRAYHIDCAPGDNHNLDNRFTLPNINGRQSTQHASTTTDPQLDALNEAVKAMSLGITVLGDKLRQDQVEVARTVTQLSSDIGLLAARLADLEQRTPRKTVLEIKQQNHVREINGLFHNKLPQLVRMATSLEPKDRNVWIAGPAGGGKTTAAEQLASVLGLPYEAHGAIDSPYKISGYRDANGVFRDTSFYRIYKNGGVILLDECDGSSPQALLEINGAMANHQAPFPEGMIQRHPDCFVLCAGNTWGFGGDANYVGRARLDAAFLDRFVKISWPYDENLERAISLDDTWTSVVQTTRKAAFSAGAQVVISPRASIKGGQLLAGGSSRAEVAEAIFGCYYQHSAWSSIGKAVDKWCRGDR